MKKKQIKNKKQDYKEVMAALKIFSLSDEEKSSIRNNIMSFIEAHPLPKEAKEERPKSSLSFLWTSEVSPHVVQLYRDKGFLRRATAAWLRGSLKYGGGAILTCSPENALLIRQELMTQGIFSESFEDAGRFAILDSDELMGQFMVNGMPDENKFMEIMGGIIKRVRLACNNPAAEIRTSGEMVNTFFHQGNKEAAKALELIWNKIIEKENIRRLCSYHVDNLSDNTHEVLSDICHGHTELLPEEDEAGFEQALTTAMAEILGEEQSRHAWKKFTKQSPLNISMPESEAVLIGLRAANPSLAKKILNRVRSAFTSN